MVSDHNDGGGSGNDDGGFNYDVSLNAELSVCFLYLTGTQRSYAMSVISLSLDRL